MIPYTAIKFVKDLAIHALHHCTQHLDVGRAAA